jgi:hypothetical protein
MPKLHQYRNRNACYVLTSIRDAVVTFQLTPEGEKKMRLAGIAPGSRFQRAILLDLYRTGDAFTLGTGTGDLAEPPAQLEIDFADDPDPETAFPACSDCASVDDLHLTLCAEPAGLMAKLQCPKCRAKATAAGVDTSIPVALLSLATLKRLFALKPAATRHDSVTRLQDLFQAEFESKWAALRKTRRASQPSLLDGAYSNELNLGT